eukprot:TRINITY_DN10262_c0_g1_i1.p1 TRINITY_DN10262_c0_g1~~TRINITY_DN10262_c0_g1_i1.p1  ORF type:complete len:285 (+),score=71.00 TRINITY_DN10262_c0_g1_i1:69-923(+)
MQDPAEAIPLELFTQILQQLPIDELDKCATVSKEWNIASRDNSIWNKLCLELWKDKVYVPNQFVEMRQTDPRNAYLRSIEDGARQHITEEELLLFQWNFRFKASAGEDWLRGDPWWNGETPWRQKFTPDGSMEVIRNPESKLPPLGGPPRRWAWIDSAVGRTGPKGSFLQVNNYPPYVVTRLANWGFLMESCWVMMTSFPLPLKGSNLLPELHDENLKITTKVMAREAMAYNIGIQLPYIHNAQLLPFLAQHGIHLDLEDILTDDEDDEEREQDDVEDDQMDEE